MGFPDADGSSSLKEAAGLPDAEGPAATFIPRHRRKRLQRDIILRGIKKREDVCRPLADMLVEKHRDMAHARRDIIV